MLKKPISDQKFILVFLTIFALLSFPLFLNYFFLKNIGEFLNEREIYEKQNSVINKKIIYGSGLFDDVKAIKLYSFEQKNLKLLLLDPRAPLSLEKVFLPRTNYNMGYIIASINDLESFIYNYNLNNVKTIILPVDFWWFINTHDRRFYYEKPSINPIKSNSISPEHLILPFKWIKEGKISLADYKKYIFNKSIDIGIRGELYNSGFAPDGSNYYTDIITGASGSFDDSKFANTLNRVRNSLNKFQHGSDVSILNLSKFLKIIDFLKKEDIKLICFFPPLSSLVNQEMKNYNYSYIAKLKRAFSDHNIIIYDFTEASKIIKTSDCEFVDGFHGGDVLYAKILQQLAIYEPNLASYIDNDYLKTVIENYNDLAMIPCRGISSAPEIDFLKLGCPKNISP